MRSSQVFADDILYPTPRVPQAPVVRKPPTQLRRSWNAVRNIRKPSLLRSNLLVGLAVAFLPAVLFASNGLWAHLLPVACLLCLAGTLDTARLLRKRWDFYHAGVLFFLYADLMALAMLTFAAFSETAFQVMMP